MLRVIFEDGSEIKGTHDIIEIFLSVFPSMNGHKEEPKIGDYIVFGLEDDCISTQKPYKVISKSFEGYPEVVSDQPNIICRALKQTPYRVVRGEREMGFARANRSLNEFKAGDLIRKAGDHRVFEVYGVTGTTVAYKVGIAGLFYEKAKNLELVEAVGGEAKQ